VGGFQRSNKIFHQVLREKRFLFSHRKKMALSVRKKTENVGKEQKRNSLSD
jgi:hypothetical protein